MDILNLNDDNFSGKSAARKVDENLYNPGPDQGQNGIYKAIVRMVPYAKDPEKSKYRKYYSKLVNPLTNDRLYIDCPSSEGKSSILWSLDKEIKKLKDTEPTIHEELSKYFSRAYNFFSPVYIKKDPQFPALEGKIKIFPFGFKIDNLIQQQLNPEADIISVPKINPYHPISGKDFVLVVKRKTKTWRDFDSCKFMDQQSPLILTIDGKEIPMTTDQKRVDFVTNFLLENTPDMTPYYFKPWSEEDYVKVAAYVKALCPYKQILENVLADLRDEKMKKLFTNSSPVTRTQNHGGEDLEFSNKPATSQSSALSVDLDEPAFNEDTTKNNKKDTAKKTTKKEEVADVNDGHSDAPASDDLDELFKDM